MKRIVLIAAFYIFGKEFFRALHVANDVTQVGDFTSDIFDFCRMFGGTFQLWSPPQTFLWSVEDSLNVFLV